MDIQEGRQERVKAEIQVMRPQSEDLHRLLQPTGSWEGGLALILSYSPEEAPTLQTP